MTLGNRFLPATHRFAVRLGRAIGIPKGK